MRRIITFLLLLIPALAFGQTYTANKVRTNQIEAKDGNAVTFLDSIQFPDGTRQGTAASPTIDFNGNRVVTRLGLPAVNAGGSTLVDFLNNYLFPSTNPTATLSVRFYINSVWQPLNDGLTREFMSSGSDLELALVWGATRPVACTPLQTINVDGVNEVVLALNEGQTQTGELLRTTPRNTVKTFTITVTSQDGKTGTASRTINWQWKRYWGSYASAVPPTDGSFSISNAAIIALNGAGVGTGNELSTTRVKTYNGINGAGKYLVFAFPSTWGTPVFKVNGLTSTAFTKIDRLFTNSSGGITDYQVWVSNTEQNSAIASFAIE